MVLCTEDLIKVDYDPLNFCSFWGIFHSSKDFSITVLLYVLQFQPKASQQIKDCNKQWHILQQTMTYKKKQTKKRTFEGFGNRYDDLVINQNGSSGATLS